MELTSEHFKFLMICEIIAFIRFYICWLSNLDKNLSSNYSLHIQLYLKKQTKLPHYIFSNFTQGKW